MKLTNQEIGTLIWCIGIAETSETDFIDCHRIEWSHDENGNIIKKVPTEYEDIVKRTEDGLRRMKAIRKKLERMRTI